MAKLDQEDRDNLTGRQYAFPKERKEPLEDARHVRNAVAKGEAQAGVLLRPVTVAQILEIAHGGERMPPKSTFFFPKPRTGLVFRDLS